MKALTSEGIKKVELKKDPILPILLPIKFLWTRAAI